MATAVLFGLMLAALTMRLSKVLTARVVLVTLASTMAGLVVGGDVGLMVVVVVGLAQQLGIVTPTLWVGSARTGGNVKKIRRASQLIRIGQWPRDTAIDRWLIGLRAFEVESRYEEAEASTSLMLRTHMDPVVQCVGAANLGQLETAGPIAVSLLTQNFRRHFDRVFHVAAAFDPVVALGLLTHDLAWASKRYLTGFAPLLAYGGRVDSACEATALSQGTSLDILATRARALHNTDHRAQFEAVVDQLGVAPARRYRALAERLRSTPASTRKLTTEQVDLLDRIELIVVQRRQITANAARNPGRPLVTLTLTALCIVGFVFELTKGDTTSVDVLRRSGAFLVYEGHPIGGWWRFITASFLHAGPIHLGFNMFA